MKYDQPNPIYHSGYTLIELVVVMSIIALMIALVLPVLSVVKRKSGGVVCMSNMRQLYSGVSSFAAGNRDQLPPNRTPIDGQQHNTWRGLVVEQGYLPGEAETYGSTVGEPGMSGGMGAEPAHVSSYTGWSCPENADDPLREVLDGDSECLYDVAAHYAYNGEITWKEYPLSESTLERDDLIHIKNPSNTIAFLETRAWWPDLRLASIKGRGRYPFSGESEGGFFSYWHSGRTGNWAMHDGSVVNMRLMDTFSPVSHWHLEGAEWGEYDFVQYWMAKVYR